MIKKTPYIHFKWLYVAMVSIFISFPSVAQNADRKNDTLIIPQKRSEYKNWKKNFEYKKSGLLYKFETKGAGAIPKSGDLVIVHYKGLFRDNEQFDNSYTRQKPLEFNAGVGQVITGWDEALAIMPEGSKMTIIVPPHLGYGNRENGPIPANSTLIFEIELLKVIPQLTIEPFEVEKKAFKTSNNNLKYAFITETLGTKPDSNYIVTMHYTGYLPDGKIFDSSLLSGEPEKFIVGSSRVIKGVNEAVKLMAEGSKARFIIPSELAYGKKGYYTLIKPNTNLTYDIEILEVKNPPKVEPYISNEDTVILENGLKYIPFLKTEGEKPQEGYIIGIHYTGYFENGEVFDSSVLRDEHIMFSLGEGQVMPGMEKAIRNMHVGEKARVLIPWQLAYGEEGNPPIIAPKTNLIFDIEFLFVVK
ncbi:MAG: FKBP-type peptidyl-prolyl cis-trans isomerase [Salinivirgaceae bacterium]|nr:FKBP-type peptidyl-prolyl cis-trans isomerase [Salinivirgaceae bacterium]